jgi:thiamine transporter
MRNKETMKLVLTATLIAMAIAIDVVTGLIPGLNLSMPFGGRFFGIALLPMLLIGLLFGLKFSLPAALLFATYQFFSDGVVNWSWLPGGLSSFFWVAVFDYLIPFSVLGLTGLFKGGMKSAKIIIFSFSMIFLIRIMSYSVVGVIIWSTLVDSSGSWAYDMFNTLNNVYLYSLIYNSLYNLTTLTLILIITLIIRSRMNDLYEIHFETKEKSVIKD